MRAHDCEVRALRQLGERRLDGEPLQVRRERLACGLAPEEEGHFRKTLEAMLRRLVKDRGDAGDTAAMALYRAILEKAIVVDRFHFKKAGGAY